MKEFIKSYVLLFSIALVNFICFLVFILLESIGFHYVCGFNTDLDSIFIIVSLSTLAFFIINTIICKLVKKRYVTSNPSDEYNWHENIACVLINEKGEKIVFKEDVWAKGRLYIIKSGRRFGYSEASYEPSEEKIYNFTTNVTSKWRNVEIHTLVTISLFLNDNFDAREVFDSLLENKRRKERLLPQKEEGGNAKEKIEFLYLDEYFEDLFIRINEKNQDKLTNECAKLGQKLISEAEFLDNVLDFLLFPEKTFSNIANVSICLTGSRITACKGMACEKTIV